MNYVRWFSKAQEAIQKNIGIGEQFEVKSLFSGTQWEKLSTGDRRSFGKYFSSQVKDGELPGVRKVGECKNHHNMYERIE